MSEQAAESRQAQVHDLGYTSYDGPRRPQSVRYQTIAKNLLRASWRGFWRMKAWMITTVMTVFVLGTLMFVLEGVSDLRSAGLPVPMSATMVAQSFDFLSFSALILSLTICSSIVANDLRTGAFVFYFSRPIRPRDYVVGKLVGVVTIMSMVLFVGPVLLAIFRVGLADSGEVAGSLAVLPKTALMGVVCTVSYAVLPLAFSAMARRKRNTIILWATFMIVVGPAAQGIATGTDIRELAAISLEANLDAIALFIFDFEIAAGPVSPPPWLAAIVIAGYLIAAMALLSWRVSSAERAGLGGS